MLKRILMSLLLVTAFQLQAQPLATGDPTLFLPGDVSTNLNERDMSISADGTELYYTLLSNQNAFSTILYRKKHPSGIWSTPEVASFSGQYRDLEPALSPDGNRLFFSSDRPHDGKSGNDYDIWIVERTNGVWGTPKNLGPPVNTDADEFYPSITRSGNLYFTAAYDKGIGKEDIYLSRWVDGSYTEAVALDSTINSAVWEFNAFVSPDESFILFTSYGRKDELGGGDLYISIRGNDGLWKPSKNLVSINSKRLDYCPFVTHDNKTLFFTSQRSSIPSVRTARITYEELMKNYTSPANGSDDIYVVNFQNILSDLEK